MTDVTDELAVWRSVAGGITANRTGENWPRHRYRARHRRRRARRLRKSQKGSDDE